MNIRVAVIALASTLAATPSLATQQRSFVASNGVDSNPCTITAPCRSFAAAIAKTSPNGEVIVLDSAGYGPVTINKSVSIIAPQGVYAGVTVASGDGVTVDSPGAIVALRGLSINGQGGNIGINVKNASRVHIEGCVISDMASNGILHTTPSAELSVLDAIVRNNGGTGIGIAADASIVIDHVRSEHNTFDGFYIVPAVTAAQAVVTDSIFAWNGANGISVDSVTGATTSIDVERSTLSENAGAGLSANGNSGTEAVVIAHSAIHRNGVGVAVVANGDPLTHSSYVTVSRDSFADNVTAIRFDGPAVFGYVSANSVASHFSSQDFQQVNSALLCSYKDNVGPIFYLGSITSCSGK